MRINPLNTTLIAICTESSIYLDWTINLIKSIDLHLSEVPNIKVLTDNIKSAKKINEVNSRIDVICDLRMTSRDYKTTLYKYVDTEYGLFIDSDAKICSNLPWKELPDFDLAIAPCAMANTLEKNTSISYDERSYTFEILNPAEKQYNSGVMFWKRNNATKCLFNLWNKEWLRYRNRDQFALHRAISRMRSSYPQQLNIFELERKFNDNYLSRSTVIYHVPARVGDPWKNGMGPLSINYSDNL